MPRLSAAHNFSKKSPHIMSSIIKQLAIRILSTRSLQTNRDVKTTIKAADNRESYGHLNKIQFFGIYGKAT